MRNHYFLDYYTKYDNKNKLRGVCKTWFEVKFEVKNGRLTLFLIGII